MPFEKKNTKHNHVIKKKKTHLNEQMKYCGNL